MSPQENIIEILLVEDSPADARLTLEALKGAKLRNRVSVVTDGEQAMEYLHRTAGPDRPAVDLILLDLNLPKKSGREVLTEIKSDSRLRHIPVVILTTSQAEHDILRSYQLQASCYVTKPVALERFLAVIQSIDDFWLQVVRFPPHRVESERTTLL